MHLFKILKLITTELTVQFTSSVFSGFESSGEVLVTLALSGGVNSSNITVMISLNGIIATGHLLCIIGIIMCICNFFTFLLTGDDFNTTSLTATFPVNATNTTVRITVKNDNIVEGNETFNMSLNVPSSLAPGIIAGLVSSATGIIIDSSSKAKIYELFGT